MQYFNNFPPLKLVKEVEINVKRILYFVFSFRIRFVLQHEKKNYIQLGACLIDAQFLSSKRLTEFLKEGGNRSVFMSKLTVSHYHETNDFFLNWFISKDFFLSNLFLDRVNNYCCLFCSQLQHNQTCKRCLTVFIRKLK